MSITGLWPPAFSLGSRLDHGADSRVESTAAKPHQPSSKLEPRGPEVAGARPQIRNPSTSGPKSSNPHGKSGQESIHPAPQDVSRPIQRQSVRKSGIRGLFMPQKVRLATVLLAKAEKETPRFQNMGGPSHMTHADVSNVLKRFGTFEETHANLYVAHQAKNFAKSRPRS